jgi:predicted membrane metal-binding protein
MIENSKQEEVGSTDRAFGFVFAIVFLLIALFPLFSGQSIWWTAIIISFAFGLTGLAAPKVLSPLNRLWTRFGLLLHKITSPIILGIMFFLVITPMGIIMRVLRKNDPLKMTIDHQCRTYWIERTPPGPRHDSFTDQF